MVALPPPAFDVLLKCQLLSLKYTVSASVSIASARCRAQLFQAKPPSP